MGHARRRSRLRGTSVGLALLACMAMLAAGPARAGGEAGAIILRDQGFFWVGVRTRQAVTGQDGATGTGTVIEGQMQIDFQLVHNRRHPYPLLLIHNGGTADLWKSTPDGRDGLADYFLAAGFDVYMIDRPGFGRPPGARGEPAPAAPLPVEAFAGTFTAPSRQFPGGGKADSVELLELFAGGAPQPITSDATLKENLAQALDRIGPLILVTTSAGGPAGWLAVEARPALIKGVLALESLTGITSDLASLISFKPALMPGQTIPAEERPPEREGLAPCRLQPDGAVRTAPAFAGKKILYVATPLSIFAATAHCHVRELDQLGADAQLARLVDAGIEGNGHLLMMELNNGEIARKVLLPWLSSIR